MTTRSPTAASDLAVRSTSVTSSGSGTGAANVIERCFNKLKQWRGLAMRSDKTARNHHSGQCLTATLRWGQTFTNTA